MSSEARKVYDEAIVIDGLNVSNWESDAVFERLRAGNITAINATVATWENFVQTMAHLAAWMRRFRERHDIVQVKETADIHAAKELGKTGIILSFQNASPIENELDRLGLVPRPRGAGDSTDLSRDQSAGQRLLGAKRLWPEQLRRRCGARDEPARHCHRLVARWPEDDDGRH